MPKKLSPLNCHAKRLARQLSICKPQSKAWRNHLAQLLDMAIPIIKSTVWKMKMKIRDPSIGMDDLCQEISMELYRLLPKWKINRCTFSSWTCLRARHTVSKISCQGPLGICPKGHLWWSKSARPRLGRDFGLKHGMLPPEYLDNPDCKLKDKLYEKN